MKIFKQNFWVKFVMGWVLMAVPSLVLSVPVSRQKLSVDGEAILGGVPTAQFNFVVRDALTPPYNGKAHIQWATINPELTNGWHLSNSMVDITWDVNDDFGGIQIYTDNTAAIALPRFVDPTLSLPHNHDSNPAGLLLEPAAGVISNNAIPMGWCVKPTIAQINPSVPDQNLFAADPETGPVTGAGNRYQWFYMLDKRTPAIDRDGDGSWTGPNDSQAFINGDSYIKVIDHRGIHMTQGPADYIYQESKRAYIYFMANFDTAASQATYKTSRLTLEAYIE